MAQRNRHGLGRTIPESVKREVRRRSKFGCVICRAGLYTYEHIEPTFADAVRHDADHICLLCSLHQDESTRGHLSKATIRARYEAIAAATPEQVGRPTGSLDFGDGRAELLIGQLLYSPAVRTVLRHHGRDLIKMSPGVNGEPGAMSAVFTDSDGKEILWLKNNEWIGALENWDIEVVGQRVTVRRQPQATALALRLDPPGRVVVEKLDMRVGDTHVLASEHTYAVGRYTGINEVSWLWAKIALLGSAPGGAAIEFATTEELASRDFALNGMRTLDNDVMLGGAGFMSKSRGISIASNCPCETRLYGMAMGTRELDQMRNVVFSYPHAIGQFIGQGRMM